MAQGTESVDVKLPSGETISAIVPQGASDAQVHSLLRSKHPEYFSDKGKTAQAVPAPAPASGPTEMDRINAEAAPWNKITTLGGWGQQLKEVPGAIRQGLENIPQGLASGGSNGLDTLFKIGAPSMLNVVKGAQDVKAGRTSEGAGRIAGGASGSVGGNWLVSKGEQAGRGDVLPAAAETATTMFAPKAAAGAVEGAAAFNLFDKGALLESSHALLNKAANSTKRMLSDVRQNISNHVGSLVKDIAAADYADKPNGSIPLTDLIPEMDKLATAYKAEGQTLPVFDKFRQRIEALGPNASFYDVQKLRSEFGSALNAARSQKDVGSSSSLYKSLTDKMSARADELGRQKQFQSYNQTYSKMMDYEREGALGKLMNAPAGQEFFDTLRSPKSAAELKGMTKDFQQYGLNPKWREQLLNDHGALVDYVNNAGKNMGGFGKIRAIVRHPVAAGAGFAGGHAVGGFLGGTLGAIGAGNMVERMGAAQAVSRLGGAPEIAGEMGKRVEPVNPNAEMPQATKGVVDKGDLVSALKSLGYSKEAATAAALQALKSNPPDFDTALRGALNGPKK